MRNQNNIITFASMSETKEVKFLLRISGDLKAKAEKQAKKDKRSLNSHILTLIERNADIDDLTRER